MHGLAATAPALLYSLYRDDGVAAPGEDEWLMSPPACRHAATNSAQKYESPFVALGHTIDLAMPIEEKGFPTCRRAKASIAASCDAEHPICTYE